MDEHISITEKVNGFEEQINLKIDTNKIAYEELLDLKFKQLE